MGSQGIVEMAINDLAEEFLENPDEFFNEYDFHHKFFCRLYLEFNNLIHPEYPTQKRFIKEKTSDENYVFGKHCFEHDVKKGVRDHYDFVIFKEEFYNKYKNELGQFNRLWNKDENTNLDIKDKYIDFAFEFKYITNMDTNILKEIEFDIFELKQASEAREKYLLIFIKKTFGDEEFMQIIEPLNGFIKNENDLEILIFSK